MKTGSAFAGRTHPFDCVNALKSFCEMMYKSIDTSEPKVPSITSPFFAEKARGSTEHWPDAGFLMVIVVDVATD